MKKSNKVEIGTFTVSLQRVDPVLHRPRKGYDPEEVKGEVKVLDVTKFDASDFKRLVTSWVSEFIKVHTELSPLETVKYLSSLYKIHSAVKFNRDKAVCDLVINSCATECTVLRVDFERESVREDTPMPFMMTNNGDGHLYHKSNGHTFKTVWDTFGEGEKASMINALSII